MIRERSHYALWELSPETVSGDEHRGCSGGYLTIQDGSYERLLACPVCAYHRGVEAELQRVKLSIERSGIGARYLALEWDDLEMLEPLPRVRAGSEKIGEIIKAGHSLLLYGAPGSGKTAGAVLTVKAAIKAGHSARIENLGRLASEIRGGYNGGTGKQEIDVVRELSAVDLLVLDDIGAGETANAEVEKRVLYLVMEARQNGGKPTVITTNLSQNDLVNVVGVRIMNRLQPLTMLAFKHGKNFRLKNAEAGLW